MAGRILAVSDIHGLYDEFCALLDLAGYRPEEDRLVLLGDYVDRGPRSREVVEMVRELSRRGAVVLRGNHDDMFVNWLLEGDDAFWRSGGRTTVESYLAGVWDGRDREAARRLILERHSEHVEFLRSLPYFYETEQHIFVHAGINPLYEDWKQTPLREMLWIRETFYNRPVRTGKVVVFGHTPCVFFHGRPDVWFGGDKIGVDGGAAFGHQLNGLAVTGAGYETYAVKVFTRLNG